MKTIALILLSLFLWLPSAKSSVIDAPHNGSNSILCTDCHSYSFWWDFSPLDRKGQAYTNIVDSICRNCHDGVADIGIPCDHSSNAMEELHNPDLGDWQTKCVDCHDPHFQD